MDLREDLINYLDSSNFDDFTKIRYIYLYVCDKFSYDVRFMYGRQSLKDKIYNKQIDISNVEDFEIVCYTYCRVLVDMLALYGFNGQIVREGDGRFQHSYVVLKHKDKVIKLDPTTKHDSTRVKMNSPTLDFVSLIDDPIFTDQLADADAQINEYSNNNIDFSVFYNSKSIMQLVRIMENNAIKRGITEDQLFFEKLDAIFTLVNTRTDFHRYDDIDYYFGYLIKKFKMNDEVPYVKPAVFFRSDDDSMRELINIILVEYKNLPPMFYIMEKKGENYKVRDSSGREVLEILEQYDNYKVSYYFSEKAKMSLSKIN